MHGQAVNFYSEDDKNEALVIASYEKDLPQSVLPLVKSMAPTRKTKVLSALSEIFQLAESWNRQVEEINIESIEDTQAIELAEIAYKNTRSARLSSMRVFKDARAEVQAIKVEYDTEDKLLLKTSQIAEILFKEIETKAYDKSQYVEKYNLEQKRIRTEKRLGILLENGFDDVSAMSYRDMEDDMFDVFLGGLKYKRQQIEEEEIKAAAQAEEARLAFVENIESKPSEENVASYSIADDFFSKDDTSVSIGFTQNISNRRQASASNKDLLLIWIEGFIAPYSKANSPEKETVLRKFEAFKMWAKMEISKMEDK